jgi:hypothetical protein
VICPICETEYPPEVTRCPECGSALVARLPDPGEEITLDPLTVLYRKVELRELLAELEGEKIPYILHSGTALQMMDTQTLRSEARGRDWEARVMVVSSRFEDARAALRTAMERAAGEADDELDESEASEDGVDAFSSDPIEPR